MESTREQVIREGVEMGPLPGTDHRCPEIRRRNLKENPHLQPNLVLYKPSGSGNLVKPKKLKRFFRRGLFTKQTDELRKKGSMVADPSLRKRDNLTMLYWYRVKKLDVEQQMHISIYPTSSNTIFAIQIGNTRKYAKNFDRLLGFVCKVFKEMNLDHYPNKYAPAAFRDGTEDNLEQEGSEEYA